MMDAEAGGEEAKVRRRNQTACEACRSTKIRCQPSEQPGVCKKCLESKRECISRTTPRTRRSKRQIKQQEEESSQASPSSAAPKAASTFSIDFAVPTQPEVDDSFDVLREMHEAHVDKFLLSDDDDYLDVFETKTRNDRLYPTPPTSNAPSNSIESMGGKPQFNLSSAEGLLESFKLMLPNLPCIVLGEDDTVSHLAKTRPFVLLAVLAAASGSKTLQGHSLYDEEFRKVLGLKFVASGERTLELLQGILIYCAWYPFHLRPKNKQVFHYVRMCTDLITDLELDQELATGTTPNSQQLEGMRAYLGHCYLAASFATGWRKYKNLGSCINPWTATCADILERNAQNESDLALATFTRLSNVCQDASDAFYAIKRGNVQQTDLVLLGLETQVANIKQRIPQQIRSSSLIKSATLFTDIYVTSGSLSAMIRPNQYLTETPPADLSKLPLAIPSITLFLNSILAMEEQAFQTWTAVDWGRLVLAVVLSFRLSFPLPENPLFDHIWARNEIRLDLVLERFCADTGLTPSSRKVDTLSASKVVMRVVKDRYQKKLLRESSAVGAGGCPMLDGSLEQYFPLWDASLNSTSTSTETGEDQRKQPVFHDLWATMTMSWASNDTTF